MTADIVIEDERWQNAGVRSLVDRAIDATSQVLALDLTAFEISILACDDARIAQLNTDFRDKPQPTNVLSWPSAERGADAAGASPVLPDPDHEEELGDIAIAYDTCAREAAEAGKPFSHHVTHLIVHGTLHLLGYDHLRDADATLMEGLESEILGNLDIPDPYS